MNIVITGGAGFIGSHLAERLLKNNNVFVIDNLSTGRKENITSKNIKLYKESIHKEKIMRGIFEETNPDIVIHCAASYKDPKNWKEDAKTNVVGTINMVKESIKHNVKHFIYFQTALTYGKAQEQPITLNHPINPSCSYAISKTAAEQYIDMSGLNYTTFRLANAYGPRNLSGPAPTFYNRLTKNLPCFVFNTRRDFVYIDDLVDIVMKSINDEIMGVYHISTGKDFAIKDIYDEVCKNLEIESDVEVKEPLPGDEKTILIDPSKTLEVFGFIPNKTLEYGIKKAVEWYKKNGIKETFTHLDMKD
jgi:UDP-glucose 4-epimerase